MSKGTAQKINICGKTIKIGDTVRVRYTTGTWSRGGTIGGKITELWDDGYLQGRVDSGWCFHDHDQIIYLETLKI